MYDSLKLRGMVIKAAPAGDFDKRVVILTGERGKITVFARGARRVNSPFLACTRPFCFGTFFVTEGREYYRLRQAEAEQYFAELSENLESACFGSYFLEWADYYGRESIEAKEMLNLLYRSFRALLNPSIPNTLVRCIFELKIMAINGEYPDISRMQPRKGQKEAAQPEEGQQKAAQPEKGQQKAAQPEEGQQKAAQPEEEQNNRQWQPSTLYAVDYIIRAPIRDLYHFVLCPQAEAELREILDQHIAKVIDRKFQSLDIFYCKNER